MEACVNDDEKNMVYVYGFLVVLLVKEFVDYVDYKGREVLDDVVLILIA